MKTLTLAAIFLATFFSSVLIAQAQGSGIIEPDPNDGTEFDSDFENLYNGPVRGSVNTQGSAPAPIQTIEGRCDQAECSARGGECKWQTYENEGLRYESCFSARSDATGNVPDTTDTTDNSPKLLNPLRAGTVEELFMVLLDAVKTILQIFFVIALVWCGWLFIEAQGNEDKLKKARKAFMYTIIGGVIVVGISFILGILNATVSSLKVI